MPLGADKFRFLLIDHVQNYYDEKIINDLANGDDLVYTNS